MYVLRHCSCDSSNELDQNIRHKGKDGQTGAWAHEICLSCREPSLPPRGKNRTPRHYPLLLLLLLLLLSWGKRSLHKYLTNILIQAYIPPPLSPSPFLSPVSFPRRSPPQRALFDFVFILHFLFCRPPPQGKRAGRKCWSFVWQRVRTQTMNEIVR